MKSVTIEGDNQNRKCSIKEQSNELKIVEEESNDEVSMESEKKRRKEEQIVREKEGNSRRKFAGEKI